MIEGTLHAATRASASAERSNWATAPTDLDYRKNRSLFAHWRLIRRCRQAKQKVLKFSVRDVQLTRDISARIKVRMRDACAGGGP